MKQCEDCPEKGWKGFKNSRKFGKMLCRKCYRKRVNQWIRAKKKEEHLCLNCGKKVEPTRCPHCKKIIDYQRRCKKCLNKNKGKYDKRNKTSA